MASDGDLHRWADTFVEEVLNNGTWKRPWHFTFQGIGGPDPWVVFHMCHRRMPWTHPADATMVRCYHGCPLSVAQDMIQNGFVVGDSEALWFTTFGMQGYGRMHAQDRSRSQIGWRENGWPCLWTQAVVVSFTLPSWAISSDGHEPVGRNTISLCDVMRLNQLPGASRCLQAGDRLHLWMYPFGYCSVELHVNLRHYRNWQAWDVAVWWWDFGSDTHGIIDQLWNGEVVLCCCKEREPFSWENSEPTCGAIVLKTMANSLGWQRSGGKYWYCPVCKVIRNVTPSSNKFSLMTPDSL